MAAPKKPRRKKAEQASRGLTVEDVASASPDAADVVDRIALDGGAVLASYRDPLFGTPLVLAVLPIEQVERTPWQRDLSDAHSKRLVEVIDKVGLYLDPIVATREGDKRYHSPNGGHRLEAMKRLGAKSITAIVVPDRAIAWRILALNTEKAHAVKEKALEAWRMAAAMDAEDPSRREAAFVLEFEEPVLLTLGAAYEQNGRFSGGSYRPALKRVESFLDAPLSEAIAIRKARGAELVLLDAKVGEIVAALKERGIQSPYLRPFVAARINPVRFAKEVTMSPEELIAKMREAAEGFDLDKVKPEQVTAASGFGGGGDDEG